MVFSKRFMKNAMMVLFQRDGIQAKQQVPVKVYFEGQEVGYYVADIVVEDKIIIELKAAENLMDGHRAQTLNYLRATNMKLAILLNFGKQKLQYERLVN